MIPRGGIVSLMTLSKPFSEDLRTSPWHVNFESNAKISDAKLFILWQHQDRCLSTNWSMTSLKPSLWFPLNLLPIRGPQSINQYFAWTPNSFISVTPTTRSIMWKTKAQISRNLLYESPHRLFLLCFHGPQRQDSNDFHDIIILRQKRIQNKLIRAIVFWLFAPNSHENCYIQAPQRMKHYTFVKIKVISLVPSQRTSFFGRHMNHDIQNKLKPRYPELLLIFMVPRGWTLQTFYLHEPSIVPSSDPQTGPNSPPVPKKYQNITSRVLWNILITSVLRYLNSIWIF